MRKIPLTKGKTAIVDDEDFAEVSRFKWFASEKKNKGNQQPIWYAARAVWDSKRKCQHEIKMHILILGKKTGFDIDHINCNGLDNRRSNLRHCTRAENLRNARPRGGSSQFKGVCWIERERKWSSRIGYKGKQLRLGEFQDEVHAAIAYNVAAQLFHGPFARLNDV